MGKLDLSELPGTHRTRVFVGGSYAPTQRLLLDTIADAVRVAQFHPVMADQYNLLKPDFDVHDVTLWLLHSCRIAVFELSTLSGALMEIERCSDYNISRALLLYQDPYERRWPQEPEVWQTSAMVKSLALENRVRFRVRAYVRPADAATETRRFLTSIRRSEYGQLHGV